MSRKLKKIALVIPSLSMGGAENSLVKLANGLSSRDIKVDIFLLLKGKHDLVEKLKENISICYIDARSTWSFKAWVKLYFCIRKEDYDWVVGWSTYANFVVLLVCKLFLNQKVVVSERIHFPLMYSKKVGSKYRRFLVLNLMKYSYKYADIVTANSKRTLRVLGLYTKTKKEKCCILHNMLDFHLLEEPAHKNTEIPRSHVGPKILALGRLDKQKGFDILLKSIQLLRREYNWSLVIVGDGTEICSLRAMCKNLGIENNVFFMGQCSDPGKYYNWADIFVMPSRYEGFPNVLLEAIAFQCKVISSDCMTGPKEMSDNGKNIKLVPVGDSVLLAEAIELACEVRDNSWGYNTGVAYDWVKERYDSENVISYVINMLNEKRH